MTQQEKQGSQGFTVDISDWHKGLAVNSDVYFLDTNDIRSAGYYTVSKILSETGQVAHSDTILRLKSKSGARDAEAIAKELYATDPGSWGLFYGTWNHLFGPGRHGTDCRIVIQPTQYKLVAAQAFDGLKWVDLSRAEMKDLSESLFSANNVDEDPQSFDLSAVTALPDWALPQAEASKAPVLSRKRYVVPAFVVVDAESAEDVKAAIKAGGLQALAEASGYSVSLDARIPIREVPASTELALHSLLDAYPAEALLALLPTRKTEEYL